MNKATVHPVPTETIVRTTVVRHHLKKQPVSADRFVTIIKGKTVRTRCTVCWETFGSLETFVEHKCKPGITADLMMTHAKRVEQFLASEKRVNAA